MLVFLLPLVLQVEAQKIKIQYEKTTDFSKFKTHMQGRDAVNCMVKLRTALLPFGSISHSCPGSSLAEILAGNWLSPRRHGLPTPVGAGS